MKKLSISVVIPAYNCEMFIGEALQSIQEQTRRPDRVVVVNDGSTDQTGEVITKFALVSSLPLEVVSQNNGGIASARNAGVERCKEDLIAFLDADDRFYPSFLERAEKVLASHPDLVLCFIDHDVVDTHGTFLRKHLDRPEFRRMPVEHRTYGVCVLAENPFMTIVKGNIIPMNMMVRRVVFDRVEGFDEAQRAVEDRPFLIRMGRQGKFGFIDEPLAMLRRHAGNTSGVGNAFLMVSYADLALECLENDAPQLRLNPGEIAAIRSERRSLAAKLLYTASNEGNNRFFKIVWHLIRQARMPWWQLPKALLRYFWRCLRHA